ncbi:MAG: N-acetyltransferase [Novosphingobium lindaniclasticum]|jgi:RimJ/RimL family protein N-acetyltransferase|uniref:GNAT family N-acetyltransferase n=1 Tax=Novosphingobium lindaniclasticum TaxID=1329895 RepID=UPI002409C000|nr:GNAT family N-acetyltransferase [Novosphingobium lindaniclasticum]MDF2639332.1 N-acetyltransferase [Novosphingobium lindaniclasticum]
MFVRSERLFLRPGWPEDQNEFLALIDDESVVRNLTRAPWPYSSNDARRFLEAPQDMLLPRFLITEPGEHGTRIVGCIGFSRVDGEVNLGYWIGREHWGRGFASEAVRAVLPLARLLGHKRIVGSHFIDNPASGRVLEKAGFLPTGAVAEKHSEGRGGSCLAREYALDLDSPDACLNDSEDLALPCLTAQRAA